MAEMVVVNDGSTVEECEVTETYTHRGDTFAHVEGDTISGIVEVSN